MTVQLRSAQTCNYWLTARDQGGDYNFRPPPELQTAPGLWPICPLLTAVTESEKASLYSLAEGDVLRSWSFRAAQACCLFAGWAFWLTWSIKAHDLPLVSQFRDEPRWDRELLRDQRSRDSQADGGPYHSQHQPFLLVSLQQGLYHQLFGVSEKRIWRMLLLSITLKIL